MCASVVLRLEFEQAKQLGGEAVARWGEWGNGRGQGRRRARAERAPAMAAERKDDNDEHDGQRMQIKGKVDGKSASAHIVDGETLREAQDAVKPSEPTTNGGGDELDGERTGCLGSIQST